MKFISPLLLLLFIPVYSLACSCAYGNFSGIDNYLTSDFVGIVEIERTENIDGRRVYKAFLKPIEIMKGTMPEFVFVQGKAKGEINSAACEIRISPDEKWLFYLKKNPRGEYHINICSFPVRMTDEEDYPQPVSEQHQEYLEHFRQLSYLAPEMHTHYRVIEKSGAFYDFMRQYEEDDLERGLFFYKITLNSELELQHLESLKSLTPEFDRKLENYLKRESEWEIQFPGRNKNYPSEITYIISIELK